MFGNIAGAHSSDYRSTPTSAIEAARHAHLRADSPPGRGNSPCRSLCRPHSGARQFRQLADPVVPTAGGQLGSRTGGRARRRARMERAIRRIGPSADDGRGYSRRRCRIRRLSRRAVAIGGAARRHARDLRGLHRRSHARPAPDGFARRATRIHQIDLGLSRCAGQRRTHRARARDIGATCADLCCGRADLWRRPPRHRGNLGRRVEVQHDGRRPFRDPLHGDARLRRPPPRFLSRRVSLGARNPAARRPQARAPDRLLGRRLRPDAVHADHVQTLCGRLRRRRAARCCRIPSPT